VSSLRPLDTRVARAELHFRQCKRCLQAFGYCRSREPGRLYCFECSPLAGREREQRARRAYRRSDEGREQHRDEERRRRERLRGVGDRRCAPEQGGVETRATTAAYQAAVEEPADARDTLEWVLVAWPEVLAAAERMLGEQLGCPCCWRRGRVTEVLELAEWRRRCEETS
jgi:hypothetical protein